MNVSRQVFALQLNDHTLSTSAVQFAVQDVNGAAAMQAPETDTFEQVRNNFMSSKLICLIVSVIVNNTRGYRRGELIMC